MAAACCSATAARRPVGLNIKASEKSERCLFGMASGSEAPQLPAGRTSDETELDIITIWAGKGFQTRSA